MKREDQLLIENLADRVPFHELLYAVSEQAHWQACKIEDDHGKTPGYHGFIHLEAGLFELAKQAEAMK